MKHLSKPQLAVNHILQDCATSYRPETRGGIKKKLLMSSKYIQEASEVYDIEAQAGNWSSFCPHETVNSILSKDDMCDVYESKFVKSLAIRNKYYDYLMSLANTGKCPICGIGQVSTLDHYLAKTIYPTYTVTPYNLVPVCKDCNFEKLDARIDPDCAPLHPYYDDVDSYIWLSAQISNKQGILVAEYFVNDELMEMDPVLFQRLKKHMQLYSLEKAYAIQAATEIAENVPFWKKKIVEWGDVGFSDYIHECLVSKEAFQRNTWNTALLRALLDNINVIKG